MVAVMLPSPLSSSVTVLAEPSPSTNMVPPKVKMATAGLVRSSSACRRGVNRDDCALRQRCEFMKPPSCAGRFLGLPVTRGAGAMLDGGTSSTGEPGGGTVPRAVAGVGRGLDD